MCQVCDVPSWARARATSSMSLSHQSGHRGARSPSWGRSAVRRQKAVQHAAKATDGHGCVSTSHSWGLAQPFGCHCFWGHWPGRVGGCGCKLHNSRTPNLPAALLLASLPSPASYPADSSAPGSTLAWLPISHYPNSAELRPAWCCPLHCGPRAHLRCSCTALWAGSQPAPGARSSLAYARVRVSAEGWSRS